jgi:hypothetical protein
MDLRERNKKNKFEEFGEDYDRKIIDELEKKSAQRLKQSDDKTSYGLFLKGSVILFMTIPLFYAYYSPLFTLNLNKPLKANFIE